MDVRRDPRHVGQLCPLRSAPAYRRRRDLGMRGQGDTQERNAAPPHREPPEGE